MVVGYHHFRNPPFVSKLSPPQVPRYHLRFPPGAGSTRDVTRTLRLCKSLASRRCMSPYYKAAGRRGANFLSKRISGSFWAFFFLGGGGRGWGGRKRPSFLGNKVTVPHPENWKLLKRNWLIFLLGGGRRTHHCWEESDSLTPSFLIDWLVLDLVNTAVEREKERDLFFGVSFFS